MSEIELLKVRLALADGRIASANRHAEFMAAYGDLAMSLVEFYRERVVGEVTMTPELSQKIEEFRKCWQE